MSGEVDTPTGGSVRTLTSTFVSAGSARERKRMNSADTGITVKSTTRTTASRVKRRLKRDPSSSK